MTTWSNVDVTSFLHESLAIEGIHRSPTAEEVQATAQFLMLRAPTTADVELLQRVYAPGCPLRDRVGDDVRVGTYVAPGGGTGIRRGVTEILEATTSGLNPWRVHVDFELLHPFGDGNGRTGRTLWAWAMLATGANPFTLGFLHRFYYQTLEAMG